MFICGQASTLLCNLLFLSQTLLLTGCSNNGGVADLPSDWNPSFPDQPRTFTCDGASGQYAELYCERSEIPVCVIAREWSKN